MKVKLIIFIVLNLVINGLPSIHNSYIKVEIGPNKCFKPCYKWITFNTKFKRELSMKNIDDSFKPCYKWITFNTLTEGIDAVFMVERSHFYMVAKIIHFSVF